MEDSAYSPDAGRVTAEKADAFGDPAIGTIAHAAILGAVNHVDAIASRSAAIFSRAASIHVVIAGEIDERILHLDPLDIADAPGRNIGIAAAMDPVARWRSAQSRPITVVKPLRHNQPFPIVPAVKRLRPSPVPNTLPRRVNISLPSAVKHA